MGFALGGNRSGKSEMGAQLDAVVAHGRNHPDVQAWALRNKVDVSGLQYAQGRVWSVALTDADSRRYVRPKVAKYLPPSTRWKNREGDGEASARLPNGGLIVFKSVRQGRDGFQGDAVHMIRFDEEPRDLGVVREALMRLVDHAGRMILTMTPLHGWTELLREFAKPAIDGLVPDIVVRWLHGTDNPHVPADVLTRLLSMFGVHERAARERGEITALEGRVYPMFRRDLHEVEPFRCPDRWPRFVAIDWGTSVPTAILLCAYDEATDTVHIIGEVHRSGMTISDRAAAIRLLEQGHPAVSLRWADPEDASTSMSLIVDYGIALEPAQKAVRYGINVVSTRLQPDALGRPHLVVHRGAAPETMREIEGYVWLEGKDAPRKVDDHAMDALRYLCVGVSQLYGLAPPLDTLGSTEALAA
jgi:phage terminase large subunit-like protein